MKGEVKEIVADKSLVAFCGLYCGACKAYLKGKCPGCRDNVKASWCKIRECCLENHFMSCADCTGIKPEDCKKYTNFMSKAIGFILNSDRKACIERISIVGYENFAAEMTEKKIQTIRRK
jgi:hypothetical protein